MKQIIILGITRRSGTNFLNSLLQLHPQCASLESLGLGEDYLIPESPALLAYIDRVTSRWNPKWFNHKQRLQHFLSLGLLHFLNPHANDKVGLTKTPSTEHIHNVFKLFPNSYLLVIVRNARDVAESAKRSFGWSYEAGLRRWAQGAKRIITFKNSMESSSNKFCIVRYEDLHTNTVDEVTKILKFCELDKTKYNFKNISKMPVIGSSTLARYGAVNWKPVHKNQDFNPLNRSNNWSRQLHYRHNRLCGKYSKQFGYQNKFTEKTTLYYLINIAKDIFLGVHFNLTEIIKANPRLKPFLIKIKRRFLKR